MKRRIGFIDVLLFRVKTYSETFLFLFQEFNFACVFLLRKIVASSRIANFNHSATWLR